MAIETLGAALRQINRLFADGVVAGLSDAQLLERFVGRRDAAAFEAIVARHGPMVLSVCRGILRDPNDAEDAFQATFLVLVKKAGSIRGQVVLGGWLYRVAHRVAIQANIAAARRRAREREAGQMTTATASSGPEVADDLLPALHEEIARLPEKYRLPILLCDLEGLPQAQAAGQLHWSERTLRRRLAEARDRLKTRLARRGLRTGRRDAGRRVPARGAGRRAGRLARRSGPRGPGSGQSHDRPPGRSRRRPRHSREGAQDHAVAKAEPGLGRPAGCRADGLGGLGRRGLVGR